MRKIFITLTTFFTLSLLLKIGLEIRHNLIYYSVYYAQNVHHNSNTDPVMATLIDNLSDIPKPENNQIDYDFDGINIIYMKTENTRLAGLEAWYDLYHDNHTYYFNSKAELVEYSRVTDNTSYNIKDKRKEARKLIYSIIQPIIDIQPKPPKYANFQWLFNITYGRRFQ